MFETHYREKNPERIEEILSKIDLDERKGILAKNLAENKFSKEESKSFFVPPYFMK